MNKKFGLKQLILVTVFSLAFTIIELILDRLTVFTGHPPEISIICSVWLRLDCCGSGILWIKSERNDEKHRTKPFGASFLCINSSDSAGVQESGRLWR